MKRSAIFLWVCLFYMVSNTVSGWPSISTMIYNYPRYQDYTNNQMIDLAGLPERLYKFSTCAIRVSYAWIKSGHTIDITSGITSDITSGQFNWAGVQASRKGNEKYIIRVGTWRRYLESKKGPADVVSTRNSSSFYMGKKGIIIFQDCPKFRRGVTGHVDLYNGSDCKTYCYFRSCNDIRLFEFS